MSAYLGNFIGSRSESGSDQAVPSVEERNRGIPCFPAWRRDSLIPSIEEKIQGIACADLEERIRGTLWFPVWRKG